MTQKKSRAIDMTHQQIGRWFVLEIDEEETEKHSYFDGKRKRKRTYWKCKCSCEKGTIKSILGQNLRNGTSLSCGCWNKERDRTYEKPGLQKDYTGQTINNIYVISKSNNKNNGAIHWNCKCLVCGTLFEIDGRHLNQNSKYQQYSCGCVKSKGEFHIALILNLYNYKYSKQYSFKKLPNRYFDFALLNSNNEVYALIEYDGEQHFNKNSKYYSEEMIKHDKEKNTFCLQHKIPLYRIPYWDFNKLQNIEDILNPIYLIKEEKI